MSNTTPITDKQIERFARIDAAYMDALNGRDAETVSILDLLPTIFDAVPDASPDEIEAALRWAAGKAMQEANELRRYAKAKFGNVGKHVQPNDGTLPFKTT